MSTSKKLDEITELAMLLQNSYYGLTIDELSEKLERPRRAIERMMEVLREKFGERLEVVNQHNDRKKHWRLAKGTMNFLVTFSDSEIAKLELIKKQLQNQTEQKIVSEIIEKIKALNPIKNHKVDIDILMEAQGYAVRQQPKENIDIDILEKINYAIDSNSKIKLSYTDINGEYYEPIIEPYGIKIGLNYYLIAKENVIKTFKFSRISEVELLDEYYEIPENFNIQEYCNLSFGICTDKVLDVILKFDKSAADYAFNYFFHPTQTAEKQKDGSLLVKFSASGSFEIVTELLKWRESVKIIAPKSLINEYNKTVKLMYKNIKE